MAIYPGARVRLIPPGANDPRIIVLGAILHTDAGDSKSLYGYFNGPSGGVESHFHVPKELQVEQYRDTAFEADANFHGNSFELNGKLYGYVSIETQGLATDPWNAYQLAEIKKLLLWLSQTHRFPLVECDSATSPGVGYHTMWGAPGPWTPVAKDCPGPKRIAQFNFNIVPWFQTANTGDLSMADAASLEKQIATLRAELGVQFNAISARDAAANEKLDAILAAIAELDTQLNRIEASVASRKAFDDQLRLDLGAQFTAVHDEIAEVKAAVDALAPPPPPPEQTDPTS